MFLVAKSQADPLHGRRLPAGSELARTLGQIFTRQQGDVFASLRRGKLPTLSAWTPIMRQHIAPHLERHLLDGAAKGERDIVKAVRAAGVVRGKSYVGFTKEYHRGFRFLKRQNALDWVDEYTFHFVKNVNSTTESKLKDAVVEHLETGGSVGDLEDQLVKSKLFGRKRAKTVAVTESARAMWAGQLQAATESGIATGSRWLCSAGACSICLGLNNKVVKLGKPFIIIGVGPYSVVTHAPSHPRCRCANHILLDVDRPSWSTDEWDPQVADVDVDESRVYGKLPPRRKW